MYLLNISSYSYIVKVLIIISMMIFFLINLCFAVPAFFIWSSVDTSLNILVHFICTGLEIINLLYSTFNFSFVEYETDTTIATLATSASYLQDRFEKDDGQPTNNPHILAARIISRGGPITHNDINQVLRHQGIEITENELEELIAIPYKEYSLPVKQNTEFKENYPRKGEPKWGIYMFINNISGTFYVGSSSSLGERLLHYWKSHANKLVLRSILQDIRNNGLHNFTLRVYDLPLHLQNTRCLLALEQYYILSMNPGNNSLFVVNTSPGGKWLSEANSVTNSVQINMFHNGELIYVFNSMVGLTNNALSALSVKSNDLIHCLNTGELLWNEFTFTRGTLDHNKDNLMTREDLLVLINNTKKTYKSNYVRKPAGRPKSTTPPVDIVRLSDNQVFEFSNFNAARTWLLNEAKLNVSNDTIRLARVSRAQY